MGVARPSLTKTPHTITGVRIRVWSPVQVVPDVTGTKQHAEHVIVSYTKQQVNKAVKATKKI